jgi:hypothetical protein
MRSNIVTGARALCEPAPLRAASPVAVFPDEIDTPGAVWPLTGSDRGGSGRDIGTARPCAHRKKAPGLLLDGYAVEARL